MRRIVVLLVALTGSAMLAGWVPGRAAGGPTGPRGTPVAEHPNIVFILADDLSTNLLPYMPHVLALQRRGMTFSNYTVTDSLCCPSRASIFTGNYPHDTRIVTNALPRGGFDLFHQLGEERRTFATALQAAGYRTALMGKYLNSYDPDATVDGQSPYIPPGWSQWDVSGDHAYRGVDYPLTDNQSVRWFGRGGRNYLTSVLDRRAQDFVDSAAHDATPFLLEVAPYSPHSPYAAAPQDRGSFPGLQVPRTPAFNRLPTHPPAWLSGRPPLSPDQIATIDADFRKRADAVQSIDRMVGDLVRTLRRDGQADNTIFVFSSDNGYHMGEYRLLPGKLAAFDTDVRVPLVVAGPGIPAGVTNPAVASGVDLAPTFDAIGGAAIPRPTDGRSMLPLFYGQQPARWPTLALIEHRGPVVQANDPDLPQRGSGNPLTYAAMRSATFLYVEYTHGGVEYYDLRTDPFELHNIAYSLGARRLARLHRELAALANCHDAAECQRADYVRGLTYR